MIIAVAATGWFLFLIAAWFVWVAAKTSAKDTNALAAYCLSLMVSDHFSSKASASCTNVIEDAIKQGYSLPVVYGILLQQLKKNAIELRDAQGDGNTTRIIWNFLTSTYPNASKDFVPANQRVHEVP